MALQLGALRAALIDAGARSEADAAAEEAAGHQLQFDALQSKVETGFSDSRAEFLKVRADMAAEFVKVRAEMTAGFAAAAVDRAEMRASIRILQWGQALIVAGIISLVAKAFFHAG
jgi:hypothetical protein